MLFLALTSNRAFAIKTAATFDVNYDYTSLNLSFGSTGQSNLQSVTLQSFSGYEVDYNVALYDLKTVASISFTQFLSSTQGPTPITRFAIGGSYYFIRVNGQRVILDNQVEGRVWGVSPAFEFSTGINVLAVKDQNNGSYDFNASIFDVLPRVRIEIPLSTTVMALFRLGYLMSLSNSNQNYTISYKGMVASLGITLSSQ